MVDDVYTLTPTTVLNTRFSADRFFDYRRLLSTGFDMTTLGFPAKLQAAAPLHVLPEFDFSNYSTIGEHNQPRTPYTSFQIFSSLTKVHDRHIVKFGTDLRLYRQSNYSAQYSSGRYVFNQKWANGPADNSAASPIGQDLASFMMGLPNSGQFDLNAESTTQSGYIAFFVQDDFRVAPSLTLNLGLRYEKDTPTTERYNRMTVGFDPAAVTSVRRRQKPHTRRTRMRRCRFRRSTRPADCCSRRRSTRNAFGTSSHDFSPRFGFAWKPAALGNRTVIRGGTGMFFLQPETGRIEADRLQPVDFVRYHQRRLSDAVRETVQSVPGRHPAAARRQPGRQHVSGQELQLLQSESEHALQGALESEHPAPVCAEHDGRDRLYGHARRASGCEPAAGFRAGAISEHVADARLGGHQFPLRFAAESVRGPGARHESERRHGQPLHAAAGVSAVHRRDGPGGDRRQFVRTLPDGEIFQALFCRAAIAGEHAVQPRDAAARPLERFGSFAGEAGGGYRPSVPLGGERRLPIADRPRQAALGSTRGFANQVVGGWSMSGVFTRQSGDVLQWDDSIYLGGDLQWNPHNVNRVFDTTRFVTASGQQLSQDLRRFPIAFSNLRGDSIANFDLALIKSFPIRERLRLVYHCEFFNALNHPVFSDADNSPTSTTFGKITNQLNLPRHIQMALKLTW